MTDFVTSVEQELLDATGFVPERKYRDRQKYLGALLRACADIEDEVLDKLSDEAYDWCHRAADSSREGQVIPDFDGGADETTTEEPTNEHPLGNGRIETDANNSLDAGTVVSVETVSDGVAEGQVDDKPAKEKKKAGRPKGKKASGIKIERGIKPQKVKKERTPKQKADMASNKRTPRGLNPWKVTNGCKSDIVCRMAAQANGTTMKDIVQATGHTHYNLFNRLKRHGYDVRYEEGRIYLIGTEPILG